MFLYLRYDRQGSMVWCCVRTGGGAARATAPPTLTKLETRVKLECATNGSVYGIRYVRHNMSNLDL